MFHGFLSLFFVLGRHLLLLCGSKDGVDEGGGDGVVLDVGVELFVLRLNLPAIGIDELQDLVVDEVVATELAIEGSDERSVQGNKDVGHDASAAIDGAPLDERLIDLGGIEVYAVQTGQFSVLEAGVEVFVVGFLVSFLIGFLHAASRGSVVVRNGQSNHGTVGQVHGSLNESLPEGASSDDDATVMVLNGSADDFRGRGGGFIDEHHDASFLLHESAGGGFEFLARGGASLGIDDHGTLRKELRGDILCGRHEPSAVGSEVKDEVLHALLAQFLDFIVHLHAAGGAETFKADVADGGVEHIARIKGVERDFVADDVKEDGFFNASSDDFQPCFRAFRSAEDGHDGVTVHFHAGDDTVVASDDSVARQDAHFLTRSFPDDLQHEQGVFDHVETDADAFKVSGERFVEFLRVGGVGVGGVRVKFGENAVDGIFHEFFLVHAVHVETGDGDLCHLQFLDLLKIQVAVGIYLLSLPVVLLRVDVLLCKEGDGEKQEKEKEF